MSRSGGSREAGTPGLYCEIDGTAVALQAEDLSTAGFFVQTPTPYPMDREVEIIVRSSVGELVALGQVVQVVDQKRAQDEDRRPGFGLLFISLEDDQRAFIGLTLDALARSQRARAQVIQSAPAPAVSLKPAAPKPAAPKPAAPTSLAPSPELKQVAADLRAELNKLQGKTAWTALGLDADSPLHTAKEAFLRVSKRFHPHKFARYDSAEISQLATEVFIAYKRSYSVLTKLAPRTTSGTNTPEQARAPTRPLTSMAPAANASMRPAAPRPSGNRTRTR